MQIESRNRSRRKTVYWICQIIGWGVFVGGNVLNLALQDKLFPVLSLYLVLMFISGISITHLFRRLVKFWNWMRFGAAALLPRVLLGVVAMSLAFTSILAIASGLLPQRGNNFLSFTSPDFAITILNFSFLFALWAFLYFGFQYFTRQRQAEIKNLELKALNTEIELNNLRSQLRPHFMFNSLNSIRALIDEDPPKAKKAVTNLSAILRNTLLTGKHSTIPLSEEMALVEKYLDLEGIRFEERLSTQVSIDSNTLDHLIPPLIIQQLVENAIKHGIAQRTNGGKVSIKTSLQAKGIQVEVRNTGSLHEQNNSTEQQSTSTGIVNTERQLELLYGSDASFRILQEGDEVVAKLLIPKQ